MADDERVAGGHRVTRADRSAATGPACKVSSWPVSPRGQALEADGLEARPERQALLDLGDRVPGPQLVVADAGEHEARAASATG